MRKGGKFALGMLTACFLGMYGSAVQAQFGGLGALKKVLDSAIKQTPQQQAQPAPQTVDPRPSSPANIISADAEKNSGATPKGIIDISSKSPEQFCDHILRYNKNTRPRNSMSDQGSERKLDYFNHDKSTWNGMLIETTFSDYIPDTDELIYGVVIKYTIQDLISNLESHGIKFPLRWEYSAPSMYDYGVMEISENIPFYEGINETPPDTIYLSCRDGSDDDGMVAPLSNHEIRDIRLNWLKNEGYTNKYIGRYIEGLGTPIDNVDDRTSRRNGISGVNVINSGKIAYTIMCKNVILANRSNNIRIRGILSEIYGQGSGIYSNDDSGEQFYAEHCEII